MSQKILCIGGPMDGHEVVDVGYEMRAPIAPHVVGDPFSAVLSPADTHGVMRYFKRYRKINNFEDLADITHRRVSQWVYVSEVELRYRDLIEGER